MLKALRRLLLAAVLLLLVVLAAAWLLLRASLPKLDGELVLDALDHEVQVSRDALGVPTVRARTRLDLARAMGFLHAQERFFQMDLQRRVAAGELAALVGSAALPVDRKHRLHRLRQRAERLVAHAGANEQSVLFAYTRGVNQGLEALLAKPFEYFVLNTEPQPWRPEDSLLTLYAMFLDLTDENGQRESQLAVLSAALPPALLNFLVPASTPWDAPLIGEPGPLPPIPGPEVVDLRGGRSRLAARVPLRPLAEIGSNSFAVDGARGSAGATVTGDMHLGLSMPNIWYRMRLIVERAPQGLDAVGVTLPGTPVLVAGSNGHVAWTFTNSYGDWTDLVALEFDPSNPSRYRTPEGWAALHFEQETIAVRGGEPETMTVTSSIWGPLVERAGRRYAVHWLAHEAQAVNMHLMQLEQAVDVGEAVAAAQQAGLPPQNFVVADADGHIAWTIAGRIPRRRGFDGSRPVAWLDGVGWDGWAPPAEYPLLIDPPGGRLWTANALTVAIDGAPPALLGDGGYAFGARARQIRDDLLAQERFEPQDLLAIELDDRALYLAAWQRLLLDLLDDAALAGERLRTEARDALETWDGRASIDSSGYLLLRRWHDAVFERVVGWLTAPARRIDPDFELAGFRQAQGAVWALLQAQPPHLLDPAYESWDRFLLQTLDEVLAEIATADGSLVGKTWGDRNRLRMQHPLSRALPLLGRFLDAPAEPLPGDTDMPRVQRPGFGASQRMSLTPGREQQSLFHMPGGQGGHPLSPYYRAGHEAWARGQPAPLLPQAAKWQLRLLPSSAAP